MSFQTIAEPFIKLGIPVFPLVHRDKVPPAGLHWDKVATTDPAKIAKWDAINPDYNVGLAALPDGEICFLEFDIKGGVKPAANEMEQDVPLTRTQRSGKGFAHYIFLSTERSRKLGNRSVNLAASCTCDKEANRPCLRQDCKVWTPHHHHEWFSFRADNKYLVGAGSIHPNGVQYSTVRDVAPIPIPDWLCDWIEKNSTAPAPKRLKGALPVSDEFDFDEMMNFYGIGIIGEKDDVWQVVEECPGVKYRHSNSTLTAFYWDGSSLGWSCFAQGCPLHGKSIGQVIAFLNAQKGEPYKGVIWDGEDDSAELAAKWNVERIDEVGDDEDDAVPITPVATVERNTVVVDAENDQKLAVTVVNAPSSVDYAPELDDHIKEMKRTGEMKLAPEDLLPVPPTIAINDPDQHTGLEFPGDCAMYGVLGKKCKKMVADNPTLQMGWLYASELGVASVLDIEDDNTGSPLRVRSNLYVALLGPVGAGKNVHMDLARASIAVPGEETFVEESPGSHSGLMLSLSEEEPLPRILFLDELINVFNACSIQLSQLPGMLCCLFNKDKTGSSVKKGKTSVYAKLSILGGLAVNDSAGFARVFNVASVKGMYDRFIFGYATTMVKFRPVNCHRDSFNLNPVHFPNWVWDVKDEWLTADASRNRVAELALRIALVTAACNGDREITRPCLEAAFRFMEWQCRLRHIFKPGLAETKEAEALEAVWLALKEQRDKQMAARSIHKDATLSRLSIEMDEEDRWKLIHYTDILNKKSYYRTYAGLLSRVRMTLIEGGFITEVKEDVEDDHGKVSKAKGKTPFVILNKNML